MLRIGQIGKFLVTSRSIYAQMTHLAIDKTVHERMQIIMILVHMYPFVSIMDKNPFLSKGHTELMGKQTIAMG